MPTTPRSKGKFKEDASALMSRADTYRKEMLQADAEFHAAIASLKSSKDELSAAEGVHARRHALSVLFRRVELSEKYEASLRAYVEGLTRRIRDLERELKKYQPRLER